MSADITSDPERRAVALQGAIEAALQARPMTAEEEKALDEENRLPQYN